MRAAAVELGGAHLGAAKGGPSPLGFGGSSGKS